jgi:O-antigen ligase/Flp pilus assembly protein TadD
LSEAISDTGPRSRAERFETAALAAICFMRLLWSGSIHADAGFVNNALLALLLIAAIWRRPRPCPDSRILFSGAALYFGAAFISIYFSIAPWLSLRWFLFRVGDLLLLLLAMGRGRGRALATAMVAAMALSAAFALRQRLGGFEATIASGQVSEYALETLREGRVFGLTFSPDMLAAMIAGVIPALLSFIILGFRAREERYRTYHLAAVICGALLCLFLPVLVLTRSVGGFMAACAGAAAWVFFHLPLRGSGRARRRTVMVAAAAMVVMVAGAGTIMAMRGSRVFGLDSPNNPLLQRLDNWVTALKVWREFPLTGAGEGQAGLAMLFHRSLLGNEAKHAHNALIESLAETGPLGLTGLGLVFAALIMNTLKLAAGHNKEREGAIWFMQAPDPEHEMALGLGAGAVAVALHSMMDFDFAVMEVAAIFWIGCAAASAARSAVPERGRWSGSRRALAALALFITALAELYQARGSQLRERAQAAAQAGEWTDAGDLARRALKWDPVADDMYSVLGQSILMGPTGAAAWTEAALRRASALNPRNPFYYRDLGISLSDTDRREAGEMFRRAVALYPNSMDMNLWLGRWLSAQGQAARAEKVLQHAADCQANNSEALFELGRFYLAQGREQEGLKEMELSTRAAPASGARALSYARELEARRGPREALDFLAQWSARHPDDVKVKAGLRALKERATIH